MDNQDHNSSCITAESSSQGTGISIIQLSTSDSDGDCQTGEVSSVLCSFPHSNTTVPAVSLLILCVETLGRINSILFPHFLPLLDVTVHLCFGKTKESAWEAWNSFPDVNDIFFLHNINNPYYALDLKSPHFCLLEHTVIYDRTETLESVNEVHNVLFLTKIANHCKTCLLVW